MSLTAPADGATFPAGSNVTLQATAGDADGTVVRVEFLSGGTLLGSDGTAPYSYTWQNVAAGSHSVAARAVDDRGATTISAARAFTVDPPSGGGGAPPVSGTTPVAYLWDTLAVGKVQYVDRSRRANR